MTIGYLEGFDKVNDIAKEYNVDYGDRIYVPSFWVKDGETIDDVWFNGGPNEPLNVPVHTFRKVVYGEERFENIVCRGEECVACRVAEINKSVGPQKYISVVSVADPRLVHEVSVEGKSYKKAIPCAGIGCLMCKEGMELKPRGQTKWEMSVKWAQQLGTKAKDLSCICLCGGRVRDGICKKCGSADKNARQNIRIVPFRITRTGSFKNTAYVISPLPMDDIPDWVKALPKLDLRKLYPVPSAATQAKILGVKNPFSKLGSSGENTTTVSSSSEGEDDLPF